MKNPSLGWQSWSPPYPNIFHIPRRDYPPNNFSSMTTPTPAKKHIKLKFSYWCSWYALGYFPTAQAILIQAKLIRQYHLSIDYILIDDGWRESWLPELCSSLHKLGFKVGLWYAPFTRHKHLPTYATLSNLINACKLDLLKLDFLYRPYFDKNIDNPHTVLNELFTYLNTHFPNLAIIGCGVPFSDSIGQLSIIRLSKDTALPYPAPYGINQLFYQHRVKMLFQKYLAWQEEKPFLADPDVRMFSLETSLTKTLWSKMSFKVKGIGDNFTHLTEAQLKEINVWLKQ